MGLIIRPAWYTLKTGSPAVPNESKRRFFSNQKKGMTCTPLWGGPCRCFRFPDTCRQLDPGLIFDGDGLVRISITRM